MDEASVRAWATADRLTPWLVYDLERIAWVIELRAGDLTNEEDGIVRAAAARMIAAVDAAQAAADSQLLLGGNPHE
ncbi:hypothetical protein [Mycobacterium sp.]|jgi:hypothetical protein|uniref:hypothetical protein n=1 Tax=Mycobacterium sp. TaxID=1785 RepID=UPI003BAF646B